MTEQDPPPPGERAQQAESGQLNPDELEHIAGGQGDYDEPGVTPDPWEPNQD